MAEEQIIVYSIAYGLDGPTLVSCLALEDKFSYFLEEWQVWARGRKVVAKDSNNLPLLDRINLSPDKMLVIARAIKAEQERIAVLQSLIEDHGKKLLQLAELRRAEDSSLPNVNGSA